MAGFDVYGNPAGAGYLVDVQADLLSGLNTCVVIPLLPLDASPAPAARLTRCSMSKAGLAASSPSSWRPCRAAN